MKKLLGFIIVLGVIVVGGTYAAAEFYFLPKQEKVWRELLADLPQGTEADFEDLDFAMMGMKMSINDVVAKEAGGSSITIEKIVAENSVGTAVENLIRQAMGKEEENYDVVRFINIKPSNIEEGVNVQIDEVRVHNVRIGIDRDLPSAVKSLTGEIGLDQALEASSADGFEVIGVFVDAMGSKAELGVARILGITEAGLDLLEIADLKLEQQGQPLGSLDLVRAVNVNLAPYMEMEALTQEIGKGEGRDLSPYNMFHNADEIRIEGLNFGVPGLASASLKQMLFQEAEQKTVPLLGIVPTKTISKVDEYYINFEGLGMMSPELIQFMMITDIKSVTMNADSEAHWDMDANTLEASGGVSFEDLASLNSSFSFGNTTPEGLLKAMSFPMQMAMSQDPAMMLEQMDDPANMAMMIYGDMELKGLTLVLQDKSLTNRLMKYGAAMMGATEADLMLQIDGIYGMITEDPTFPAALADDAAALHAFLKNPGKLTIELAPATPVKVSSFENMEDPEAIIEALGLQITSE